VEPVELIVMAYPEKGQASQALDDLKALEKGRLVRLVDAAAVEKDQTGKARLIETQDVDAKKGALAGAILGGLLGLLEGPVGVVVGAAAGAATGGMAARKVDMGFSDEFLKQVKGALQPGSSLILALVEETWAERVVEELGKREGKLIRHAVKSEIIIQLTEQ
jgi:uncharacterized membrane protein